MGYDHLRFAAEPLAVRAALQRLETGAALAPLTGDGRDCVLLVLAEVLNNVAEHAYGGQPGPVVLALRRRGDTVFLRVADRGGAVPPRGPVPVRFPSADISANIWVWSVSALGLVL